MIKKLNLLIVFVFVASFQSCSYFQSKKNYEEFDSVPTTQRSPSGEEPYQYGNKKRKGAIKMDATFFNKKFEPDF